MSWINLLYKIKSAGQPNTDPMISAKLHVNYWKLPSVASSNSKLRNLFGSNYYSRNLDIGLFLQDVDENLEEVIICLPFRFNETRIKDLSKHLAEETFLSFLLNHQYRIQSLTDCPTYKYARIKGEDGDDRNFCLYELCSGSLKTEGLTQGTMLHVKFLSYPKNINEIREKASPNDKENKNYNIYIRFRIEGLQDNDFCYNEDISNDFLQSAFSKTEMAEVKFNEKRTINHNDYQTITNGRSFLNLTKIDFFFTGSSEDENIIGTREVDDCELLDNNLWSSYMGDMNPSDKKCISYHWNLSGTHPNKVFFKTVYSSRDRSKMLKYAIVVILLSFIASVLLECVKCTGNTIKENFIKQDTCIVKNKSSAIGAIEKQIQK